MKNKLFVFVVLLCTCYSASAEIPQLINYQGRITDVSDVALDTTVDIIFSIYDDSISGSQIWTEAHTLVTINNGLFACMLGTYSPIGSSFEGANRFLGISVGTEPEFSQRSRFTSVAYSYKSEHASYADNADKLDGVDASDLEESAEIVALLKNYVDSVNIAPFQNLFHFSVSKNSGEEILFTSPADKTTYLTSVTANANAPYNYQVDFLIDGNNMLRILTG